jgi:CRISPR-associated endoribonuclease Cas6
MRFQAKIEVLDSPPHLIPTNYRRNFASLIKEAINSGKSADEFYQRNYGDKKANIGKPFTYSVYMHSPRLKKDKNKHFLEFDENTIGFNFSTNDYEFLMQVYNGMLKLSKDFSPFQFGINIKDIHLALEHKFVDDIAIFKTYSPVVVRKLEEHKGTGYVTPEDTDFDAMFRFTIESQCRSFISPEYRLSSDFNYRFEQWKVARVYHYNEVIPAINAKLKMEAPTEVLQLIYDIGLGARRSQGFGMLEVVK